ncbi:MAG: hypothetical protein FWG85_06015 [Bacteroidetes bacterium]|nr:hypothetical protein [Bacteroidota bacterium]
MAKKIILLVIILFFATLTTNAEVNWDDYYWEKMTIVPNDFPTSYWLEFYFLPDNPQYGFAVGTAGTNPNSGGSGVFAKTYDSGNTWHASYISGGSFHAESVVFIDINTGYCSGPGSLYKTTNGGTSWNLVRNFNGSWGCYAIDNNVWIAEGNCSNLGQKMYSSTNGGNSWQISTIPNSTNNHITDFKMLDKNKGYAIGSGAIFMTSNGGESWYELCNTEKIQWTSSPLDITNINWHEDINIYNRSILIPASGGCYGGGYGYRQGAALFSPDMGLTWNTFKTKGSMFGTWLTNDSCGWVCGYYKEVYYTRDYGKNWHLMNCGIENNSHMDDLWFINDTTGFICGQGGIYKLKKKEGSISILGDSLACQTNYVILKADNDYKQYEWYQITSQGDTIPTNKKGKEVVIENAGKYIVKGIQVDDCYYVYSEPFTISRGKNKPDITLTTYCFGDEIIFDFKDINDTILEIIFNPEIEYSNTGATPPQNNNFVLTDYSEDINRVGFVYGNVEEDCIDTLWFDITFKERVKPILKTDGATTFCDNIIRTLYIENAELFTNNTWYLEENQIAKDVPSLKPTQSGTYKVVASIDGNCTDSSDIVAITITDERDALQIKMDSTFFIDSVNYGKESYRKFILHNISNKEFVLNEVNFRYKFAFTTPMSQFPITILPNDSAELIICYSPTNLNLQYDTIYINDNCSVLDIPLSGFGKPNADSTTGVCDITIAISTHSITQKEIIKLGLPVPNPTDNKSKISYKIIIEKPEPNITKSYSNNNIPQPDANMSKNFTLQLYDIIGTPIDINYNIDAKNIEITDNTETHNGEINFDMKTLNSGVYFIRITYSTASKVFSIIKR